MLLSPLRHLAQALAAEESPKSLAAGFALGMMAGLLPKSSLFAHAAFLALTLVKVNLGAGYLAAALFTLAAPAFALAAEPLGRFLLLQPSLRPLWTALYNLPVVPWTRFNDTVVLGQLLLGLALAYPVFRWSQPVFEDLQKRFGPSFRKWKAAQLLLGAQWSGRLKGDGG